MTLDFASDPAIRPLLRSQGTLDPDSPVIIDMQTCEIRLSVHQAGLIAQHLNRDLWRRRRATAATRWSVTPLGESLLNPA